MSHVFLAINGDGVGESIGSAIISDNHDELSRLSSSIKNAHQMIDQWVEGQGGKIIVSSGDEAIYQLPQAAMSQIESVRKKYNQLANTTLTAGVGSTMSEASKALIYGKMNNKNQVVHYEPQIDEMIAGADGEDEALPTEEDITNDGNANAEQQQGVEGEEGDTDGQDDQTAQFGDEDNSETDEDPNGEANGEDQEQFQDGMSSDEDAEPGLDEGEDDLDADVNAEQDQMAAAKAGQPPIAQKKPGIEQKNPNVEQKQPPVGQKQANVEQKPGQVGQKQAAPPQAQAGQPPMAQKKQAPAAAPQAQPGMEDNGEMEDESLDDSQPAHEQGLNPEQDMEHDAEENEDDEQDADNVEADAEVDAFGGNTEPADDDLEDDIADDAVNQTLDQEGMEGDEDADMEDDSMDGDPAMADENGDGIEDGTEEGVDDDGMIDDDMEDGDNDGVLSEMMHANMGDEQAEDNDDEIKTDIVESLTAFKTNKLHLEELKQSNPELYQANIMMLRAMIQMAKKFGLNPDRAAAEAEHAQGVQDAFPENDDVNVNDEQVEKGEKNKIKGVHQSYMAPGESFAGELSREGKRKPGKMGEQNKDVARSFHKQKLKEMKQIKPNLPKSEKDKKIKVENLNINIKKETKKPEVKKPKA